MTHRITAEEVRNAIRQADVIVASSSGPEGIKRLVYQPAGTVFVITAGGEFMASTTDAEEAAQIYSDTLEAPPF